jgi:hypothetical protein
VRISRRSVAVATVRVVVFMGLVYAQLDGTKDETPRLYRVSSYFRRVTFSRKKGSLVSVRLTHHAMPPKAL